ncbi:hypothetical protein EV182_003968 [Spiromyces aspiralis]|uniref:Uncharacterized protein n=1 Tax=Spiromyces aspiralis TaxID=68401 RepID=A0ACC1HTA8_9FUNG|nr:hypothetical protein EV182_003968 [Spiromyces aspiralis]
MRISLPHPCRALCSLPRRAPSEAPYVLAAAAAAARTLIHKARCPAYSSVNGNDDGTIAGVPVPREGSPPDAKPAGGEGIEGYFGVTRQPRHRPWSKQEREELAKAVSLFGNQWKKVAAYLGGNRSSEACMVMWRYVVSPNLNQHSGRWTKREDDKLDEIVRRLSGIDNLERGMPVAKLLPRDTDKKNHGFWRKVARGLGDKRSIIQCYSRWHFTIRATAGKKIKKSVVEGINMGRWSDEELERLASAVARHIPHLAQPVSNDNGGCANERASEGGGKAFTKPAKSRWKAVASEVGTRNEVQCRLKWTRCLNMHKSPAAPEVPFTAEATVQLLDLVKTHGRRWNMISQVHMPQHSPNRLSTQYHNLLRLHEQEGYSWDEIIQRTKAGKQFRARTRMWTQELSDRLVDLVAELGDDWQGVSRILRESVGVSKWCSPIQCKRQYLRVLRKSPIFAEVMQTPPLTED